MANARKMRDLIVGKHHNHLHGHLMLFFVMMMMTIIHQSQSFTFTPNSHRGISPRMIWSSTTTASSTMASDQTSTSSNLYEYEYTMDPILLRAIQKYPTQIGRMNLSATSKGLQVWKRCLSKGCIPVEDDFDNGEVWPERALYGELTLVMTQLQLPRFVQRHPDTASVILLSMLRMTFEFSQRVKEEEEYQDNEVTDLWDEEDSWYEEEMNIDAELDVNADSDMDVNVEAIIAAELSNSFFQQWNDVTNGVGILDQLFGYDHDLFSAQEDEDLTSSSPSSGFGVNDGIWSHTGWTYIPDLQNQISSMKELKVFVSQLGKRPSAEFADRTHLFSPRKLDPEGGLGAQFDPMQKESIQGLHLSNNISEMLPSEAMLLRSSSLRTLFLSKFSESKLVSYQRASWMDVPSIPQSAPYKQRMPSAKGGPILLCLDTSHSMSGMREQLSKAVVLSCVSMAHSQQRNVKLVSFSNERSVMVSDTLSSDAHGMKVLLEFLSNSFGGGTDVTGALNYVMNDREGMGSDMEIQDADVVLISDGELPNPPLSKEGMRKLDVWKSVKGVEIHGLLVGKRESEPMQKLCTQVHDFLVDYDNWGMGIIGPSSTSPMSRVGATSTSLQSKISQGGRGWGDARSSTLGHQRVMSMALKAKYSDESDYGGKSRKKKKNRRNKWDDDNDFEDDGYIAQQLYDNDEGNINDSYTESVEEWTDTIHSAAKQSILEEAWTSDILRSEQNSDDSCARHIPSLHEAIKTVSAGLIEREEEARLVLLSMLASEHILLLGVPGTGKSILGRRLSLLCGDGPFFQRLLTKFTTPEELFGPLSLQALEQDEYRRCTDGYLPKASIAFLDEIFKANSAILNTLLTILNERKFDNAGGQREDCPIRCVVGASNELPEGEELMALFDRFLIRKEVRPVSDEGVMTLLSMTNPGCNMVNDEGCDIGFVQDIDEIIGDLNTSADTVVMDRSICLLMRDLRTFLRDEHSIEISDRRLVKAAQLLRLSAASHGRSMVDAIDCILLQHCMWNSPEQKVIVREWLWDNLTPGDAASEGSIRLVLDTLRGEISETVRKTSGDVSGDHGARGVDLDVLKSFQDELHRLSAILRNNHSELSRHIEIFRQSDKFMWMDPDEGRSLRQLLLPKAEIALAEVERSLIDCRSLEMCLKSSWSPSQDDLLPNELRLSVIQDLWEEGYTPSVTFTEDEMSMTMRDAKKKYDLETFRKWKRAKKKAEK